MLFATCVAIPGAVTRQPDNSRGYMRTEIICTACGGHLGHVFTGEGFKVPSTLTLNIFKIDRSSSCLIADERHCVNSVSIKFTDEKTDA